MLSSVAPDGPSDDVELDFTSFVAACGCIASLGKSCFKRGPQPCCSNRPVAQTFSPPGRHLKYSKRIQLPPSSSLIRDVIINTKMNMSSLFRKAALCSSRAVSKNSLTAFATKGILYRQASTASFDPRSYAPDERMGSDNVKTLLRRSILREVPEKEAKTRIELAACYRLFELAGWVSFTASRESVRAMF